MLHVTGRRFLNAVFFLRRTQELHERHGYHRGRAGSEPRAAGDGAAAGGCGADSAAAGGWSRSWRYFRRRCSGRAARRSAVDDRILAEPGWDGDLVRVTGHCGGDSGGAQRRCARHRAQRGRAAAAGGRRPRGAGPRRCGRHAGGAGDGAAQRRAGQRHRGGGVGSPAVRRADRGPRSGGRRCAPPGLSVVPGGTIRAGAWPGQGSSCSAAWIRSRIAWFRARL